MSILHTLNKTPSHASLWRDCLQALQTGDTLLLIEGGVYGCCTNTPPLNVPEITVYALQADLDARGIQLTEDSPVSAISDQDFVRLSTEHTHVISWF